MYEAQYPSIDDIVIIRVNSITDLGAYVTLLEYNVDGMILSSELSRRRVRSLNKLIRVGRTEIVSVLRVDMDRGYIDLSKIRIQPTDITTMEEKWNKSKAVHSIVTRLSNTHKIPPEILYETFVWPLYEKYGHAMDAFKIAATNPEILSEFNLSTDLMEDLLNTIHRRFTFQVSKIQADIEMYCYTKNGIKNIRDALQVGYNLAEPESKIAINLIASPLYSITFLAMDSHEGIESMNRIVRAIRDEIVKIGGAIKISREPFVIAE